MRILANLTNYRSQDAGRSVHSAQWTGWLCWDGSGVESKRSVDATALEAGEAAVAAAASVSGRVAIISVIYQGCIRSARQKSLVRRHRPVAPMESPGFGMTPRGLPGFRSL